MAKKRIHLSITPALLARLDRLAEKYGLDRSGAMSYCISRVCEEESVPIPGKAASSKSKR
jgi:metal-responsive CopG/Arc/MetJ family transcriptional regulator